MAGLLLFPFFSNFLYGKEMMSNLIDEVIFFSPFSFFSGYEFGIWALEVISCYSWEETNMRWGKRHENNLGRLTKRPGSSSKLQIATANKLTE